MSHLKNTLINVYSSTVLKSIRLPCNLNGYYVMRFLSHNAQGIWKILVYWVIPIFQMLIYFIMQHQKKIIVVNIITDLIRKVFTCWEAFRFVVAESSFSKSEPSNKNSNFTTEQPTLLTVFLLSGKLLHSYLRKCLPSTQVWITMVCLPIVLSSKNVFHGGWEARSLQLRQLYECVFLRQPWPPPERLTFQHISRFNKSNHFHCFIKGTLKWTCTFEKTPNVMMKNTMTSIVCGHCLTCGSMPAVSPTAALAPAEQTSTLWKRQMMSEY